MSRTLEPDAHGHQHLTDEVVLGREVVHDDPIADSQPLGEPSERQLTQPFVDGCRHGAFEDLILGVLVAHSP
jgi:hypothetical protein